VLAQQVLMMPRDLGSTQINVDKWDGAPAARARLLRGLSERGATSTVVLTGDSHNA
jgi:alkaline phosphatase D